MKRRWNNRSNPYFDDDDADDDDDDDDDDDADDDAGDDGDDDVQANQNQFGVGLFFCLREFRYSSFFLP